MGHIQLFRPVGAKPNLSILSSKANLCYGPIVLRRSFSSSPITKLRTTELTPSHFSSLRANSSRLWSDIHSTADQFGTGRRYGKDATQTGLSRLTLTDHDRSARDWFVSTAKGLGCDVTVDGIGNTFAVRPGLKNDVPATFVGSHLDSQPLGGRFDGVLGVSAGIEMLRVLNDNWIETEGPVGVINWTNEEGARFPVSMMGSGVWAGARDLNDIYNLKEVSYSADGTLRTVKNELERIGYLGSKPALVTDGGIPLAGHFELHIEQGPRLIASGEPVGAVKGVQAYEWYEVVIHGRACHTGTTPFEHRADPLLLANRIMLDIHEIAVQKGGLASVGIVNIEPGSVNTVPDKVMFTVDIRHETDDGLQTMSEMLFQGIDDNTTRANEEAIKRNANTPKLSFEIRKTFSSPATHFNDVAIGCIEESAKAINGGQEVPRMISGAGHDSVNTAKHCPTAMVFVPCRDGVSHHPEEWAEAEHCAVGTDVIIHSVLRFDRWRHEQGHFAE